MKRILLTLILSVIFPFFLLLADGEIKHVVKAGETIYALARKYNIPAETILAYNKITDPTKIKLGQALLIPRQYTVKKGDTWYNLAKTFNTTVDNLLSMNKLKNQATLQLGMTLIIPNETIKTENTTLPQKETAKVVVQKPTQNITWPCNGDVNYMTGKLTGVTITGKVNDIIRTVVSGTVVNSGPYSGYGNIIFIKTKLGYIYSYCGLSQINVKVNDSIEAGTIIGTLGIAPLQDKAILYFMVYNKDSKPINPEIAPRG